MDDGYGGDYSIIYNGLNYPNVFKYTITGLTTGLSYRFTLKAINFNGYGGESTPASYIICVAPSNFKTPILSSVTKTQMTLSWVAP